MQKKINWTPLFVTQFLGVFNDNFLKSLICFIGVFWLAEGNESLLISVASALIIIPFLLFSPLAGRMAKTMNKQKIVAYSKLAELPIMVIAIAGFAMESIETVLVAVFLMGLQSAIYSPSKYGLIRDIGGEAQISFGTGTMELLSFTGVLLGTVLAGIVSDGTDSQFYILSIGLFSIALIGWISSLKIKADEEPPVKNSKDSINPISFLINSYKWASSLKGLNFTVLGLASFWLIGALIQMNLLVHCPNELYMTNFETSLTIALVAVGIGLGCFVAGLFSKNRVELGLVPIGGFGLSIALTLLSTLDHSKLSFSIILGIGAFFSGFFKIPLNAWIQERVEGRKLGEILAYNNLVVFLFILISAGIFAVAEPVMGSSGIFGIITIIAWLIAIITLVNIPAMLVRFIFFITAHSFFKLKIIGIENIPKKSGALIVANHISLMDSFLVAAAVPRMLRFVMLKKVYEVPILNWFFKKMNMIPIAGKSTPETLAEFNQRCQEEINNGHVVCIFPEGQITRIGQLLEFKRGIEHIASGIDAPIIPLNMDGVVGSPFSYVTGTSKIVWPTPYTLFRPVSIQIGEPMPNTSSAFQVRQKVLELGAETFKNRIRSRHTLGYWFVRNARKNYNRVLAIDENGNTITYGEMLSKAFSLALALHKNIPNTKNVGVMLPHSITGMLTNISLAIAGKVSVNIDPKLPENEIQEIIDKLKINALITTESLKSTLKILEDMDVLLLDTEIEKWSNHICVLSQYYSKILPRYYINGIWKEKIDKSDLVTINITQNEDRSLKYIPLSHENLCSNLAGLKQLYALNKSDRFAGIVPYSHCFGYNSNLWLPIITETSIVFLESEQNQEILKDKINEYHSNILLGYAHQLESFLGNYSKENLPEVKYIISGGRDINREIREQWKNHEDIIIRAGYCKPECAPIISVNSIDYRGVDLTGKKQVQEGDVEETYGRPLPGIAVIVVDKNDYSKELSDEEEGMLLVKGPNVIQEYFDDPELSTKSFHYGWFITGDLAIIDAKGFISINDSFLNETELIASDESIQ
ncbi:MAG: MFS transporter [Bacteroidia bacterium]|nr:MFS transporter [Bacteroidia bacterium]